jgi:hypothetical protein
VYAASPCRSSVAPVWRPSGRALAQADCIAPKAAKSASAFTWAAFDDNFRAAPGSSSITANCLEVSLVDIGEDQGRYMTGFDRLRDGFFDERPRWFDLTELPLCVGEVCPRDRTGIQAEAESGLTIPLWILRRPCN